MDTLSVCIAALFQVIGVSFFIKQPKGQCSPSPTMGSWLFLLATICFLKDINIYPRRYMHMGKLCQIIFELIAGILLLEISTLFIWCNLELLVFKLTRKLFCALTNNKWLPCKLEYWLQGFSTSVVGGAVLWFILLATNTLYNFWCKLKRNWRDFWSTLNDIYRMNSCERRQALRACKMATYPRRNRRCRQPFEGDGEEEVEEDEDEEDN